MRPYLSLHAAGNPTPIILRHLDQMRHHITYLPLLTGTGLAPSVRGQGRQIPPQPLRLRLHERQACFGGFHGLLSTGRTEDNASALSVIETGVASRLEFRDSWDHPRREFHE